MSSTTIKILVTAAVVIGGLGFLVIQGSAASKPYRMVDQLMVEPGRWTDKEMQVHGWVDHGSIDVKIENQQSTRTFKLIQKDGDGKVIVVRHRGPVPDTFKDGSEVIAIGRLVTQPDGTFVFESEELSAKCPSRYESQRSNRDPGVRPTFELAPAAPQPRSY